MSAVRSRPLDCIVNNTSRRLRDVAIYGIFVCCGFNSAFADVTDPLPDTVTDQPNHAADESPLPDENVADMFFASLERDGEPAVATNRGRNGALRSPRVDDQPRIDMDKTQTFCPQMTRNFRYDVFVSLLSETKFELNLLFGNEHETSPSFTPDDFLHIFFHLRCLCPNRRGL